MFNKIEIFIHVCKEISSNLQFIFIQQQQTFCLSGELKQIPGSYSNSVKSLISACFSMKFSISFRYVIEQLYLFMPISELVNVNRSFCSSFPKIGPPEYCMEIRIGNLKLGIKLSIRQSSLLGSNSAVNPGRSEFPVAIVNNIHMIKSLK